MSRWEGNIKIYLEEAGRESVKLTYFAEDSVQFQNSHELAN
jgi:hypothetical protein